MRGCGSPGLENDGNISDVSGLRLPVFIALCGAAFAADAPLDGLRSSLIGMRGKPPSDHLRGATPQLTIAKHQLRDWVESRLAGLSQRADEGEFGRRLNSDIGAAKLTCGASTAGLEPCPDWTMVGFLESLDIHRSGVFLILRTGVGIECGFDESAYIYSWSDEGWRRVWQNEQNTYVEKIYKPQTLEGVLISEYSKTNDYLVLTLGTESWCSSNWHEVYFRAFRLGPDPSAAPLVEGSQWAFMGSASLRGSVSHDDILLEYSVQSIDGGVHNREEVRRYKIAGDHAERMDPLALGPRDFVDEWLTHEWREAAFWSESEHRPSMRDTHKKLHKDPTFGEFIYPTTHCPSTPDLWQVGVDLSDPPAPFGEEVKGMYFLVRWRPPYRFTMVGVSDHPNSACTERDPSADERRTLFPEAK
jgi:hypothetical protein